MVAAVSFVFARTRLRVGLASTPKRSLVELLKPNLLRDIIERVPTALESKRAQQVSAWE